MNPSELVKENLKRETSWLGVALLVLGALDQSGAATQLVDLIPADYRGTALSLLGTATLVLRNIRRKQITVPPAVVMIAFALLLGVLASPAHVQTPPTLTAPVNIAYTLPTRNTDGSATTGQLAITKVQVFLSAEPIPNDSPMPPTGEVTTNLAGPITSSFSIVNGGTIYIRLRACHQFTCSDFSSEATKLVEVAAPEAPVNTTITITITGGPQ